MQSVGVCHHWYRCAQHSTSFDTHWYLSCSWSDIRIRCLAVGQISGSDVSVGQVSGVSVL